MKNIINIKLKSNSKLERFIVETNERRERILTDLQNRYDVGEFDYYFNKL